jgi:GMP synthase-like glutamine amidotransferase
MAACQDHVSRMRTVHVFQHAATEGPSAVRTRAEARGLSVVVHDFSAGAPVPAELPRGDILVVMGGAMGVGDQDDPRYPFLRPELDLLRRLVAEDRPVLGVCLGSQLLAAALGAPVYALHAGDPPVRVREVGWGAITFTRTAAEEPVLSGMNESEVVVHWHGDTFDLPEGATLLASSLVCKNQMFRVGRRVFGLQFHVEVTADEVLHWANEDADFVRQANGASGVARIRDDTARYMPRHRGVGDRLIDNLLAAVLE